MASRIIRPVERELFDFSGLATTNPTTIYLARRINFTPFKEVTAYVRFHAGTSVANLPSSNKINFNYDGYTEEDPGANDASNNPAFQTLIGTALDLGTGTAPAQGVMRIYTAAANIGSLASISWTIQASVASATLKYMVSIDLVCKEF